MNITYTNVKKIRKSFGNIPHITPLPNLIEVQKRSFDNFLQLNINPEDRLNNGLHAVFKSVFPIVGRDFLKMMIGLGASVAIVLSIHYIFN